MGTERNGNGTAPASKKFGESESDSEFECEAARKELKKLTKVSTARGLFRGSPPVEGVIDEGAEKVYDEAAS